MRLANGIVLDKDTTFGELKFSALRREVRIQNEDGSVSDEIKERTYDLKSKGQGRMIQVSIPASVPLKEFDYNARVELINPIADTVATATYQGADVDWYIKADDIVLTKDSSSFKAQPQAKKEPTQDKQSLGRKETFSHETAWYVNDGILKPIGKEYIFQELVNPIHNRKDNQVTVSLTVEYIDQQTKATQVSQFDLVLEKNGSNWKIIE